MVRVAKMDGTINEVMDLDVEAYPTLLFWCDTLPLQRFFGQYFGICLMFRSNWRRCRPAVAGLTAKDGVMADGQTPWTWTYEKDEMLSQMRDLLYGLADDREFEGAVGRANERRAAARHVDEAEDGWGDKEEL